MSSMSLWPRRILESQLARPVILIAAIFVLWDLVIRLFKIPPYLIPAPWDVAKMLVAEWPRLWRESLFTGYATLGGFGLSILFGIPVAMLIAYSRLVESYVYPLLVFSQSIPKIAIAPLFVVWFGFGLFPKILLTFLLCFFPTLVASMTGFRALDERVLYISRSMGATQWQTFRYIRLPAALGHIFGGFKVSVVFASTGAIVAEFVGANAGLGYLLLRATSYLDMPLIFAVLVGLSAIGILFSYAVQMLERLFMPWVRKT